MADQHALYSSMVRTASQSQLTEGKRQRTIVYAAVCIFLLGALAFKAIVGSPAPNQNAIPMSQTSSH
jgi:hypothetical protein